VDSLEYYDHHWNHRRLDPYRQQKVKVILRLVPIAVRSVLDVGCGDGVITNALQATGYEVVGLDRSIVGLASVNAASVLASADAMPFIAGGFDLVVASELLEHIPVGLYARVLAEIQRVSRRHILVSVPYLECLDKRLVRCDYCGTVFHVFLHTRSFNDDALRDLFCDYARCSVTYTGVVESNWPSALYSILHRLSGDCFYTAGSSVVCPRCGHVFPPGQRKGLAARALYRVFEFIGKLLQCDPHPYWTICSYERPQRERPETWP
jgi:SAM-dependent methyltransferase